MLGRMSWLWMRRVTVGVSCVTILCAVTSPPPEVAARTRAVHRSGEDAPGRDLGDGFKVARGSELLGTVFPGLSPDKTHESAEPESGNDRWTAVLRLTGNPITVLNRYMAQARREGFDIAGNCFFFYDDGETTTTPKGTTSEGELRALRCSAIGAAPGDSANRPEDLSVEVQRATGGGSDGDYILIRFTRRANGTLPPSLDSRSLGRPLPPEWADGVPPPSKPPRLSTVGEPIRRESVGDLPRPIEVVRGSRLVAPPSAPCAQRGGFDAVLQISGDRDKILDRYTGQFLGMPTIDHRTARFRDRTATIRYGGGEIGIFGAVAIDNARRDATFLHVWFCPTS